METPEEDRWHTHRECRRYQMAPSARQGDALAELAKSRRMAFRERRAAQKSKKLTDGTAGFRFNFQ